MGFFTSARARIVPRTGIERVVDEFDVALPAEVLLVLQPDVDVVAERVAALRALVLQQCGLRRVEHESNRIERDDRGQHGDARLDQIAGREAMTGDLSLEWRGNTRELQIQLIGLHVCFGGRNVRDRLQLIGRQQLEIGFADQMVAAERVAATKRRIGIGLGSLRARELRAGTARAAPRWDADRS